MGAQWFVFSMTLNANATARRICLASTLAPAFSGMADLFGANPRSAFDGTAKLLAVNPWPALNGAANFLGANPSGCA